MALLVAKNGLKHLNFDCLCPYTKWYILNVTGKCFYKSFLFWQGRTPWLVQFLFIGSFTNCFDFCPNFFGVPNLHCSGGLKWPFATNRSWLEAKQRTVLAFLIHQSFVNAGILLFWRFCLMGLSDFVSILNFWFIVLYFIRK